MTVAGTPIDTAEAQPVLEVTSPERERVLVDFDRGAFDGIASFCSGTSV